MKRNLRKGNNSSIEKIPLNRAFIIDRIFHGFSFLIGRFASFLRTTALRLRSEKIGRGIIVNSDSIIIHSYKLRLGNNVSIGRRAFISGRGGLTIGNNVLIAFDCVILTEKHVYGRNINVWESGFITAPVNIGNNVLIGTKAIIMPGVSIGSNVVIGAHSVVTKNIPNNCIAAGVPAKVIRKI